MNRPWMPLYVADYIADTAHLGALESGAYLHLIMHYWLNGSLPADDRQLARVARMTDREWKAAKATLQAFFDDGWTHGRIDKELAKANEVSTSNSDKAREAANRRWAKEQEIKRQACSGDAPSINQAMPENAQSLSPSQISSLRSDIPRDDFPSNAFEQFYEEFPKHVGHTEAQKAFDRIRKKKLATFEALMAGARRYANERHGQDKQFTKAPAAWLNAGRWMDETDKAAPTSLAYSVQPGTQQWDAWKAHFLSSNSRFMLARMERAREENKPVDMDSEWPPDLRGTVSRETTQAIPNAQGRGS